MSFFTKLIFCNLLTYVRVRDDGRGASFCFASRCDAQMFWHHWWHGYMVGPSAVQPLPCQLLACHNSSACSFHSLLDLSPLWLFLPSQSSLMALLSPRVLLMLVPCLSIFRYSPPVCLSKLLLSATTCKLLKLSCEWAQALSWTFQTCFSNYLACIHPLVSGHFNLNGSEFNYHCAPTPNTWTLFLFSSEFAVTTSQKPSCHHWLLLLHDW